MNPVIWTRAVAVAPAIDRVDFYHGGAAIKRVCAQIIAPNANLGSETETNANPDRPPTLSALKSVKKGRSKD